MRWALVWSPTANAAFKRATLAVGAGGATELGLVSESTAAPDALALSTAAHAAAVAAAPAPALEDAAPGGLALRLIFSSLFRALLWL